jgi:hypothetical protein
MLYRWAVVAAVGRAVGLVLLCGLASPSAVRGQDKTLTIENHSSLPLKVYLDGQPDQAQRVIGFVDPESRRTLGHALENGRWYVTIDPYAPGTRYKSLAFPLTVKADKHAYVYEIMDRDFSDKPVLPPDNVSIVGRWETGIWMNRAGLVIEFAPQGDGYTGRIISCSSELFLTRSGYYVGMDLITGLRRVDFNRYEGVIRERRRDGSLGDNAFGVLVEKGRSLYPYGWTRIETRP